VGHAAAVDAVASGSCSSKDRHPMCNMKEFFLRIFSSIFLSEKLKGINLFKLG
jgi:hypothetical protein